MNNDLISREALKNDFIETINAQGFMTTEEIISKIDNAPPIHPCKDCDLYFKAMTKEEQKGGAE